MQPEPHIAWAFKALALAMKAKTGARLTLPAVSELAMHHQLLVPEDGPAAIAVTRFIADWHRDPVAAGQELHAFLLTWRDGLLAEDARRTEEVIAEIPATSRAPPDPPPSQPDPPPDAQDILHPWQRRADTGIE